MPALPIFIYSFADCNIGGSGRWAAGRAVVPLLILEGKKGENNRA